MKKFFTLTLVLLAAIVIWAKPNLPVKPTTQKASDYRFITKIKQNNQNGIEKIKEFRNNYRLLGQFKHYWTGETYDSAARNDYVYANAYSTDIYQMIISVYTEEGFTPSYRETYFKDEAGRDTLTLVQYSDFNTGNWMDYFRFINRYDVHGNELLYMYEDWDETTNSWIGGWGSRFAYEYDANGNMLSMAIADYLFDDIWIPWLRMLYEYNSNNENISTIEQNWNDNDEKWVNSWYEVYELENGAWSQMHYSYWDEGSQTWILSGRAIDITWLDFEEFKWLTVKLQEYEGKNWLNSERGTASYNSAANLLNELWEMWESNDWIPDYRVSILYDDYQNILQVKSEFWTGIEWEIFDGERFEYTYDSYGNMTSYTWDFWDWETNEWMKFEKTDQWFEVITTIAKPGASQIMVYPNPANDFITIEYNTSKSGTAARFWIMDITGRVVLIPVLNPDITTQRIDISQLTPGTYILYLHNSTEAISKKIIKK
jgi:hypothetical protein